MILIGDSNGCGDQFFELLKYVNGETARWREFFATNPKALDVAVSIAGTNNVRDMLLHIFAVELRYAERLQDEMQQLPGPEYAVILLEKLAAGNTP